MANTATPLQHASITFLQGINAAIDQMKAEAEFQQRMESTQHASATLLKGLDGANKQTDQDAAFQTRMDKYTSQLFSAAQTASEDTTSAEARNTFTH